MAVSSTQAYLDVVAIKNGIVILKDGSLRSILLVSSINFALKSSEEQEDVILRYQGFLNSLNFPIQIVMQSRQMDLTEYLHRLSQRAENEPNEQIRFQTQHYVSFMQKILTAANIMDKRFYVVIAHEPLGLVKRGLLDRLLHPTKQVTVQMTEKEFNQYSIELEEKVALIGNGLASMGLRSARLETKDVIELFYATYNPEHAVTEKLTNIEQMTTSTVHNEEEIEKEANG